MLEYKRFVVVRREEGYYSTTEQYRYEAVCSILTFFNIFIWGLNSYAVWKLILQW